MPYSVKVLSYRKHELVIQMVPLWQSCAIALSRLVRSSSTSVLLKVMGTHNDFRSSAETQVKSPHHLKLDTRLLRHRYRQLFYNMYKRKETIHSTGV